MNRCSSPLVEALVNGKPALIIMGSDQYIPLPEGYILQIDEGDICGAVVDGEALWTESAGLEDDDDIVVARDQAWMFAGRARYA